MKPDGESEVEEELKFHMKLRLYRSERNFGPGVAVLMELVQDLGSLSAACKEMQMAYSKAWKIISLAEADLGFDLMEGKRGGEKGGQTILTPQGAEFLKQYLKFEAECQSEVKKIFKRYYQ